MDSQSNGPDETKSRFLLYVGVTLVVGALFGLNGVTSIQSGSDSFHDGYALRDGYRLAVHVE